jgi:tetratricopeptide (TPR) repeat protein
MSDTLSHDLIQALDSLRDEVAQKEKLAKAVLAAFKNAVSTTQKAAKLLPDLAALKSGLSLPDVGIFEAVKELGVDPVRPALQRDLRAYGKTLTALKEALNALRADTDVIRLSKAYATLEALNQPDIARHLPAFQERLKQANDDLAFNFGKQLKEALEERGLSLNVNGSKYEIGRYEVEVNFSKRAAVLRYGKDVVIPKVTLSVGGVLKAYDAADKLVAQRAEDGTKWVELLYKAWEGVRRKQDGREPSVNIMDCYVEITVLRQARNFRIEPSKRSFADYTRAQFVYDLDTFLYKAGLTHTNHRAYLHVSTKSQTDSQERSLWVVTGAGPHDGKYIANLAFEKEG